MERIDENGHLIRFGGFPKEGLTFLRQLKRNNRREWFRPRKPQYDELLRRPMEALLLELSETLRRKVPGLRCDPKRAIFRIYRDTRFSGDKTPYKTHIAAYLSLPRGEGATERPCFYIHVEPGEVYLGGGLYMPSSAQLVRIRRHIDEKPRAFQRFVEDKKLLKTFGGLKGERLKRAPKGYPANHPHLPLLQWKQFFMGVELDDAVCLRPGFAKLAAAHFEQLVPFVRWLDSAVGEGAVGEGS